MFKTCVDASEGLQSLWLKPHVAVEALGAPHVQLSPKPDRRRFSQTGLSTGLLYVMPMGLCFLPL